MFIEVKMKRSEAREKTWAGSQPGRANDCVRKMLRGGNNKYLLAPKQQGRQKRVLMRGRPDQLYADDKNTEF